MPSAPWTSRRATATAPCTRWWRPAPWRERRPTCPGFRRDTTRSGDRSAGAGRRGAGARSMPGVARSRRPRSDAPRHSRVAGPQPDPDVHRAEAAPRRHRREPDRPRAPPRRRRLHHRGQDLGPPRRADHLRARPCRTGGPQALSRGHEAARGNAGVTPRRERSLAVTTVPAPRRQPGGLARGAWGQVPTGRPSVPSNVRVTDEELVARARQGDTDAYGALVLRHQSAVVRTAFVVSRSREEAQDIAQ